LRPEQALLLREDLFLEPLLGLRLLASRFLSLPLRSSRRAFLGTLFGLERALPGGFLGAKLALLLLLSVNRRLLLRFEGPLLRFDRALLGLLRSLRGTLLTLQLSAHGFLSLPLLGSLRALLRFDCVLRCLSLALRRGGLLGALLTCLLRGLLGRLLGAPLSGFLRLVLGLNLALLRGFLGALLRLKGLLLRLGLPFGRPLRLLSLPLGRPLCLLRLLLRGLLRSGLGLSLLALRIGIAPVLRGRLRRLIPVLFLVFLGRLPVSLMPRAAITRVGQTSGVERARNGPREERQEGDHGQLAPFSTIQHCSFACSREAQART
jgi:hypothetical protein